MCDGSCSDIGTGSHYPYRCPECERQSDNDAEFNSSLDRILERLDAVEEAVMVLAKARMEKLSEQESSMQ